MRDYPAGTRFTWKNDDIPYIATSNGIFYFHEQSIVMKSLNTYALFNGSQWAEILGDDKLSILSGKCAIQVNNEREFNLLMDHHETNNWSWNGSTGTNTSVKLKYPTGISYEDEFLHGYREDDVYGYKLISFAEFAKEVGIEVPMFVMKSEDGIDLYEGDSYFRAGRSKPDATGCFVVFETKKLKSCHFVCVYPETDKAFSNKQSALAWIAEQNKPKHKVVSLFNGMKAHVYAGEIIIKDADKTITTFNPDEIEDILKVIKNSL